MTSTQPEVEKGMCKKYRHLPLVVKQARTVCSDGAEVSYPETPISFN